MTHFFREPDMPRPIAAIVTVLALSGFIRADEPKEAPPLSICIRTDQLQESELTKRLKAAMKGEYDEFVKISVKENGISFDRVTAMTGLLPTLDEGDREPASVIELKSEDDIRTFVKNLKLNEVEEKIEIPGFPNARAYKAEGKGQGFVIAGKLISPFGSRNEKSAFEFIAAAFRNHPVILAEAGKLKSQLLVKVGPQVMPFIEKMGLPPGTDDFAPLVKATGYTLKASVTKSVTVDLIGTFESNEAATAAKDSVAKAIALLGLLQGTLKEERERDKSSANGLSFLIKQLEEIQKNTKPVAEGKSLVVRTVLNLPPDADRAFAELAEAIKLSRLRTTVQNNLKQIMLAQHNYESSNAEFAVNSFDMNGKSLLSWRVHILPYIEQEELYKQFKLDEPWDSGHNKKLIAKMPNVFANPAVAKAEPGFTHFRSFAMKKNKDDIKAFLPFEAGEKRQITSITDGTSNSIAVIEAADAVVWTKPDYLRYDPNGKLPRVGAGFKDGFNVAFADGSVRFVKSTIDEKMLRYSITINGGEVGGLDP